MFGDVSKLLDTLRANAGVSWAEVSRRSGVAERTIHSWRAGGSEPGLQHFARVLQALDVRTVTSLAMVVDGGYALFPARGDDEVREHALDALGEKLAAAEVRAARAEARLALLDRRRKGDL